MNPQGDDRVNWTPKLFLRIIIWILIIFVTGFFLLWGLLEAEPYLTRYIYEKRGERLYKEAMAKQQAYEAAYMIDRYGGKTPEETLDLEIKALKENNIELAYKYYDVLDQENAKLDLEEELRDFGNFDHSIIYFTDIKDKGIKECNKDGDGCTIDYTYSVPEDITVSFGENGNKLLVPKGGQRTKAADFHINEYTSIWKLIHH